MKVYDLDGVEHEKLSVDARECVAIGWTYEPPEAVNDLLADSEPDESGKDKPRRGRKSKDQE